MGSKLLLLKIASLSLKDCRRKISIAILILLTVSSIFVSAFVVENLIDTIDKQYSVDENYPWDISIVAWHPYGNESLGNMSLLAELVKDVEGVKYVIYPDIIFYEGWIRYKHKSYFLAIHGVNISDPIFPRPRYLIAGEFFSSNNESAVIMNNVGVKLLEKVGLFRGLGDNKTFLDLGPPGGNSSFEFVLKGIVGIPGDVGDEEDVLKLTNGIDIYIPIGKYNELFKVYKRSGSLRLHWLPAIDIVVKDKDKTKEIATKIKNKFT